ncbi:hypothetical protein A2U01_0070823, partial [Trifolium medium]|nr:hypothetical protein [Trifolium medium]
GEKLANSRRTSPGGEEFSAIFSPALAKFSRAKSVEPDLFS